jgi:coatomer subunit alpha
MSFNPAENAVLINMREVSIENSIYILHVLPKDGESSEHCETKKSAGVTAIWVARNRFAVLDKAHSVHRHKVILIDLSN